ncbi:SusC/RagA family TonB-linked outer membrane protein [Solitalea lacus]|uniref:SusC/RagA family TonB-linked outer membrane protein n=1 Tax=Solitalea lacus TaxID=2911172 RepID=UPI001EDBA810|nr:SusC/RagA family TonB-linked outer membrane protein [Solitalea lacus]UKJ07254.1 SusC/RagA family TonB-linked outer membrane protein [Solitalea lacus]
MKKRLLTFLMSFVFLSMHVAAQQKLVKGTVTSAGDGLPLPGVSVIVKGSTKGAQTNTSGEYSVNAGAKDVLVFQFVGFKTAERTVGSNATINVQMVEDAKALGEVVVTALGIKQEKRALGYSVTEVKGKAIAETQRENFVNALQGRVAGLTVTNTSGLPGASASVTIRGINSLSGSNQPLFIVDGLPIDNQTFNTSGFVSDQNSNIMFANRSLDFTNRGADINPDDIESITVLKGPEASALYGIDAASGAIVITTKRGKAGQSRVNYSNDFRFDKINKYPVVQQVYGQGILGASDLNTFNYFGPKYAEGTVLHDNISPFFQTAFTQRHNLALEGGSERLTYRASSSYTNQSGVVPGSALDKINLSLMTNAKISKFFSSDLSFNYTNSDNTQVFKGGDAINNNYGPMLGLLLWPSTDDASVYLNADGSRKFLTSNFASEAENPYFNVDKNKIQSKTNRIASNLALNFSPLPWLKGVGNIGFDIYTTENQVLRHPQSNYAAANGGILDNAVSNTKNLNIQYYVTADKKFGKFSGNVKLGSALNSWNTFNTAVSGIGFLDPEFVSINNTDITKQRAVTRLTERRLMGAFGSFSLNYNDLVYFSATGRNDWSSTLPIKNRSFFYPSASLSFIFTELPWLKNNQVLSYGKLKASVAQVGKDAPPYSLIPALESQPTTGGGYGYGFTGPSPNLKPEKTTSYEFGAEVKFFQDRLGMDVAYYRSESSDQIVKDLRLSYATGAVLRVQNGGNLENKGVELQLNGSPVKGKDFTWDVLANFTKTWNKLLTLPAGLQEYYVSDTWVYGNVRNGAVPGQAITTFSGFAYQRNNKGDILINPSTGLPLRQSVWTPVGDRNPDFTVGLTNTFNYKNWGLNFLLDIRKGGDIYNATEHLLTVKGLSKRTLNRYEPVVFKGVMKDGLENSEFPTQNNISIIPASSSTDYYSATGALSEADFIEKDINWLRLKDITLSYTVPQAKLAKIKGVKSLGFFVTGTDLFIITNYSGLDPVVNGNSAAVGGSGATGFDFGNFPMPRGFNFGVKLGL